MTVRLPIAALFAIFLVGPAPAPAEEANPATLEISGRIVGTTVQLDVAALKALGTVELTTSTPWTDEPVTFEAVPGDRLIAAVGAEGSAIDAAAIDGYTVTIPFGDFATGTAHIAIAMNGAPLPADQFGPFWVVYDYDSDPRLSDEAHQARSIWQLKSLVVR